MNDDKFLDEDLDTKPVTDIPGVEEADGEKLKGKGFDKLLQMVQVIVNASVYFAVIAVPTWQAVQFNIKSDCFHNFMFEQEVATNFN
ncbi:hypothetical protein Anas_08419 [Armadillidium nasatum]|uniref:Uncharacterized protein n=1 Tax=Armadillidium nasatum TaxID=96803 RepID=A0A5N5TCJ1_9CRUS|nr:hypothetical protein Anas_08419 [Armadillidium nasatum]